MAEAPQQQQQEQFNPDQAATFLANFGHDPAILKTKPVEDLQKLHQGVSGFIETTLQEKMKAAPAFRENWREAIAANDTEALKTLARFTDPGAMFKSYNELRSKMASGELKANTPFPKDGKPEEQAAWRAERGLPAKPEEYTPNIKLSEGMVIGENDKPFVDSYLNLAHSLNLPQDQVNAQLDWFFGQYQPQLQQAQAEFDAENRDKAHTELRQDWGADYKANSNAVQSLLMTAPEPIREGFFGARMPDGTAFGDHPGVMKWLAGLSRELNPAGTIIPGSGGDQMKGINEKIAENEKMMRENRSAWNKDIARQEEHQKLLDLRDQAGKRQAA